MKAILKKYYKSPFPDLNARKYDEPVATCTICSDNPAIDCGGEQTQFFVGTETRFNNIYGINNDSQFVNTFEKCIRDKGAMSQLVSNSS